LLTTLVPSAHADALDVARKAVDGSDYVNARTALDAALREGSAGPAELAEIYRLTGIVEAALGSASSSERAFARWLALEPKASLPPGTSPKITRPFNAAQQDTKGVSVKAETRDDPPSISLVVTSDPLKMIAGAKVYFVTDRKAEQTLEAEGKGKITIELGIGKRIDVRLHAVDQYGNRVVELGTKDVPIVITSSGTAKQIDPADRDLLVRKKQDAEPAAPRPLYFQWRVWSAGTIVTTGVTAYFAWRTLGAVARLEYLNANSLAYRWSDAQEAERSARRNLLATQIAGGVAGAFLVGATILYLTRPPTSERPLYTTVAPVGGGGAVVMGGRF
jgi:hypothetical protein